MNSVTRVLELGRMKVRMARRLFISSHALKKRRKAGTSQLRRPSPSIEARFWPRAKWYNRLCGVLVYGPFDRNEYPRVSLERSSLKVSGRLSANRLPPLMELYLSQMARIIC